MAAPERADAQADHEPGVEDEEDEGEDFEPEPEAQVGDPGDEDGGEGGHQGRHDDQAAHRPLVNGQGLGQRHRQQGHAPDEGDRAQGLEGHDEQDPGLPVNRNWGFFG